MMEATARVGRGRRPAISHPYRERAHARPAILTAARALFKNEPYQSISVERIAAFARVTRYTLNNHFTSKEEIFKLSREALIAGVVELVADAIPPHMETQDGVIFFLENCFSVYSSEENLEIMTSIKRDGSHHPWLEDTHERQIRGRLIQNCETFLLYHIDRADEIFGDTRLIAEQLNALAESMAYGPYFDSRGEKVRSPLVRSKNFAFAARAIGAMLHSDRVAVAMNAPLQLERAQRVF